MALAVESHPERDKIVAGFVEKKSLRQIQASVKFPISVMALQRYRQAVVVPAQKNAEILTRAKAMAKTIENERPGAVTDEEMIAVTRTALLADPILSRMEKQRLRRESWMDQAAEEKDFRALTGFDRNQLSDIELHARLTGRLDSNRGGPNVNIQINIPAGASVRAQAVDGDVVEIE